MATLEERVSRLEGAYDHLATKADLKALEVRLLLYQFTAAAIVIAALRYLEV